MRPDALLFALLVGCAAEHDFATTSAVGRVRPKNGEVWGRDLANGLGLQTWELCAELGSYDCLESAHRIATGGVEPTVLGIDEPLPEPSVSSPIAFDRVAVSACALRWERDQAGTPVVFGDLAKGDTPAHRRAVSTALIERLLGRRATNPELDALEALHGALADVAVDAPRDWGVGACVTVATSSEALFY